MAKGNHIDVATLKKILIYENGTCDLPKGDIQATCHAYGYGSPAYVDWEIVERKKGFSKKGKEVTIFVLSNLTDEKVADYEKQRKINNGNGSKTEKKNKKSLAISEIVKKQKETVKAEQPKPAVVENNSIVNNMNGATKVETEATIYKNSNDTINVEPVNVKPFGNLMGKTNYSDYIPAKYENFVGYGQWKIINSIVKEHAFMPLYIYGVSGLGKTLEIEQACADAKRPFFRVQITKDTTNEDLIGSFAIVNGNTVWNDGPVLMAYKCGGVLLLDEIDLNPALMILQGVLENKPILVTQTGDLVYPKEGFTVFATGNTKGDGSDVRFVGTSVMNDAFMERFVAVLEQKIPSIEVEKKIARKFCENNSIALQDDIANDFFAWVDNSRKNYVNGNTEIYLSTRRIQYILRLFKMTKDFDLAIEMALSRYDATDKTAFIKTWDAIKSHENSEN